MIKKKFKYSILALAFIFFNSYSALAEVSLSASIDRNQIKEEERATIILKVSGGDATEPDIEFSNDYDIERTGTSTETEFINGEISSSASYIYTVIPRRTGKIKIKPIRLQIDGKSYSTAEIELSVLKNKPVATKKNASVFVTAQIDNKNPYVNEQVAYTFRFYSAVKVDGKFYDFPISNDFFVKNENPDGTAQEYEKLIDNELYRVIEVKKYLYPSKSGNFVIPASTFRAELVYKRNNNSFFSFFSSTEKKVEEFKTEPIEIKVNDLPKDRPSDFSNIVGKNMSFQADISDNKGNIGEQINLNYKLKGRGNIFDFGGIKLKDNNNFKIYSSKPKTSYSNENNLRLTENTTKLSIIPSKKGKLIIPSQKISYFDTEEKIYKNLKTKDIFLDISGTEEKISLTHDIKETNKADVFEPKKDFIEYNEISKSKKIMYLFGFFIPPFFSFIFINKTKLEKMYKNKDKKINILDEISLIEKIEKNSDSINKLDLVFSKYIKELDLTKLKDEDKENYNNKINDFTEKIYNLKFSGIEISDENRKKLLTDFENIIKLINAIF
ncbi:MAG: BatD family protein [Cyanobacteriota bacterium]